jgi:hypothetical protein
MKSGLSALGLCLNTEVNNHHKLDVPKLMGPKVTTPKARMYQLGYLWYERTYKGVTSDLKAAKKASTYIESQAEFQPDLPHMWQSDLSYNTMIAARWADQAFPVLQMGHKAAAFMATQPIQSHNIKAPWKAFCLDVPNNLFCIEDLPVRHIFTWCHKLVHGPLWTLLALTDKEVYLRYDQPLNTLKKNCISDLNEPCCDHNCEHNLSFRLATVMSRFVLNACLAKSRPIGKHPKDWTHPQQGDKPVYRTFKVGVPVDTDYRPLLQRYLDHEVPRV